MWSSAGTFRLFFMWRVVRFTLTWLLAVALPLQGVSAATMLGCGSGQHEHSSSMAANHLHAGHLVASHAHPQAADASAGNGVGDEHSSPKTADLARGAVHKCSACASCCLSAVIPTEAGSFARVKLPDFFAPVVARALTAYVTDGLERPPRLLLV